MVIPEIQIFPLVNKNAGLKRLIKKCDPTVKILKLLLMVHPSMFLLNNVTK